MKKEKISKMLNKDPLTSLALGRTIMANRRTLLSFLSTGFGLLGGGIGIIEYVDRPLIFFFGAMAVILSLPLIIWGIVGYFQVNKLLNDFEEKI